MRLKIALLSLLMLSLLVLTNCTPISETPEASLPAPSASPTSSTSIFTPTPTEPAQTDETPEPEQTESSDVGSILLESSDKWRGIGRININGTCTAVLIDTGADNAAPTHILTSGHCVEWLDNGAITNQKVEGEVLFNFFVDSADSHIAVPLAEIVYSTMQGMDIAIIKLGVTLGELAAQEITPLPLADAPLDPESPVRVIGAPSSGLAPNDAFLREEGCLINSQVDLLEFNWHFYDHYATSCQDIFGGSSGSPLFLNETSTIYGLINTTVEGSSTCYLGAPCEIDMDGVTLNEDVSYATPVHGLLACFDTGGEFSQSEDCPLPSPTQLTFAEAPWSASQPPLSWGATLTGPLSYYRYKTGEAGVVDCRSEEGYRNPVALAENPRIDDNVPADEGFYLLCVLAGNSAEVDESWQDPAHPTVAIAQIDTTPPMMGPQIVIQESPDYFDISLVFQPPELSDYLYKFGPVETTDCTIDTDYMHYRRIPISIERDDTPIRLCVIGFDNADNPTPPLDKVMDE